MMIAYKDVEIDSGEYCLFQLLVKDLENSDIRDKKHKIESLELLIEKYQKAETKEIVEFD